MSQRIRLFAVLVAAFLAFGVPVSSAQTVQTSSTDEAAIRKVVQQVQDGWNAHDGKVFAAPFATDADYVVVNGMDVKGREAIEQQHTAIFSTIYKDSHNVGTVKSIRFSCLTWRWFTSNGTWSSGWTARQEKDAP